MNVGDVVFVLPKTEAPKPPDPPRVDPLSAEIAFWTSIANSTNVRNFDAYLEQYPNGQFVRLARNRREELLAAEAERNKPRRGPTPNRPAPIARLRSRRRGW
ncbi:MAG: hypothetical protein ACREEM_34170 [Blastocatellia bacterium]